MTTCWSKKQCSTQLDSDCPVPFRRCTFTGPKPFKFTSGKKVSRQLRNLLGSYSFAFMVEHFRMLKKHQEKTDLWQIPSKSQLSQWPGPFRLTLSHLSAKNVAAVTLKNHNCDNIADAGDFFEGSAVNTSSCCDPCPPTMNFSTSRQAFRMGSSVQAQVKLHCLTVCVRRPDRLFQRPHFCSLWINLFQAVYPVYTFFESTRNNSHPYLTKLDKLDPLLDPVS